MQGGMGDGGWEMECRKAEGNGGSVGEGQNGRGFFMGRGSVGVVVGGGVRGRAGGLGGTGGGVRG